MNCRMLLRLSLYLMWPEGTQDTLDISWNVILDQVLVIFSIQLRMNLIMLQLLREEVEDMSMNILELRKV